MSHLFENTNKLTLRFSFVCGVLAASLASGNAATFYGGFEDTVKGDYDYNDLVFSLSASSLSLNSTGKFFAKPALQSGGPIGQSGSPFWNNSSSDGASYNVGYCIYGGGNCNGGTALDPTASYLAVNTSPSGSANDVTFSVSGQVLTNVSLTITADRDVLGWYNISAPSTVHYLMSNGSPTGTYNFTPTGDFGLVANNNGGNGQSFYSNTSVARNTADTVSHFAFFGNPTTATPEPGTWALLGSALTGIAFLRRRFAPKR